MPTVKVESLPQEHVAFLRRDILRNRYILGRAALGKQREYCLDSSYPESGVVEFASPHPGVPRIDDFSVGDADAQLRMALRDTKPGEERCWSAQTAEQADALAAVMEVTRKIGLLVYAYLGKEPLPAGTARLLTKDDAPALLDWDPRLAEFLTREGTVSKPFGAFEGCVCVATGSVRPVHDPYWEVGNLKTREAYRRRGYGKAITAACVNHVLSQGKIALYETYEPNIPSIRTAESCGLVEVARYWQIDGKMK